MVWVCMCSLKLDCLKEQDLWVSLSLDMIVKMTTDNILQLKEGVLSPILNMCVCCLCFLYVFESGIRLVTYDLCTYY